MVLKFLFKFHNSYECFKFCACRVVLVFGTFAKKSFLTKIEDKICEIVSDNLQLIENLESETGATRAIIILTLLNFIF